MNAWSYNSILPYVLQCAAELIIGTTVTSPSACLGGLRKTTEIPRVRGFCAEIRTPVQSSSTTSAVTIRTFLS
jgi:hypothetical protein